MKPEQGQEETGEEKECERYKKMRNTNMYSTKENIQYKGERPNNAKDMKRNELKQQQHKRLKVKRMSKK